MDWDWVKKIAPTVAIIGTVVATLFYFDSRQTERYSWLAADIGDMSERIDKLEVRLAADIEEVSKRVDRVETRLAADIEEVSKRVDRVETRLAADIEEVSKRVGRVETRLAADIDEASMRLDGKIDKVEARFAAAMPKTPRQPGHDARTPGTISGDAMVRLLAGAKTALPLAYVASGARELPYPDSARTLAAIYSGNILTLYPEAGDSEAIAFLRAEGWRQVDPADIAGGFVLPRPSNPN